MKRYLYLLAACACIQWTRLSGTVKGINLKDMTLTLQDHGDVLTVPIDYQVKITARHGDLVDLKKLSLDEKVTLINTPSDKPKDVPDDMATQK